MLPIIRPHIATNMLFITIWTFTYFPLIFAMTGGGPGTADRRRWPCSSTTRAFRAAIWASAAPSRSPCWSSSGCCRSSICACCGSPSNGIERHHLPHHRHRPGLHGGHLGQPVLLAVPQRLQSRCPRASSKSRARSGSTISRQAVSGNAGRQFLNSLLIAAGTATLSVVVGIAAAYPLSRLRIPGRNAFLWTLVLLRMLPSAGVLVPLYFAAQRGGLLNQFGVIIALTILNLPFTLLLLKNFFDTVPIELEEAAYVEGASLLADRHQDRAAHVARPALRWSGSSASPAPGTSSCCR